MGEVSRSDLKVFRERLGCDHILGGDEDVIDFWLALSGGCDKERHARLHKRMRRMAATESKLRKGLGKVL